MAEVPQYEEDEQLEASEYGAEQMAGMPGYGEIQDPYAAEVNRMAGDTENDVLGVMEGQGAPEGAADEFAYDEELPGNDPWAATDEELRYVEGNPEEQGGAPGGQMAA
jgi:hypothetical protein